MRLEILDEDNTLTIKFANWLIKQLQSEIALSVNQQKLKKWDKFFSEADEYKSIYNNPVTTKTILLAGLKSLQVNKAGNKWIIRLNPASFVPGMNCVNLETTCRLINYGNIEIQGYPIFSTALERAAEKINEYVYMYKEGW